MFETDKSSLIGRTSNMIGAASFKPANYAEMSEQQRAQAVVLWVAGAAYQPKKARAGGLRPKSKRAHTEADAILDVQKPDHPILAASMRADILLELYKRAPDDERTVEIFTADPIIISDPETELLVTESMLLARIGLFDSLNALLGVRDLSRTAVTHLRQTLVGAFSSLNGAAQREWTLSELRLEQGLHFIETRAPSDILALSEELRPVAERRNLWDAVRLFSVAAEIGIGGRGARTPVCDLLQVDESRISG